MFGYVTVSPKGLDEEARGRYLELYCGLCRSLSRRHGQRGRLTLNYDMTFLIMVLDSLYEPEGCRDCSRCLVHPFKPREKLCSEISDYAADMNVALTCLKLQDDWADDRNIFACLGARLLRKSWRDVSAAWPRQCRAMETSIARLRELEGSGEPDPDRGAEIFGELLAEVFIYRQDRWEQPLRDMASALGRFIYIMDAVMDLDRDLKKGSYNPLAQLRARGRSDEDFRELLTVLLGECTMAYDRLPLVRNTDIMRNILCAGVWTRYESARQKKGKRK